MIPLEALIVLDTSILVHVARNNKLGQKINAQYDLANRAVRPLISVVTTGELFALARKWSWGEEKVEKLKSIIRDLTVVDIRPQVVIDRYAEIDAYSEQIGRSLGNNDAWIAATAAAAPAWLLTTDRDFDHLHPKFIQREWIDPAS
jgi:tRNA(fMet)-specific endonuclease VapC